MSGSEGGFKTCRDCGENKPLEEFSPAKKMKDGRTSYCRPCLKVRHRRYRDQTTRGGQPPARRTAARASAPDLKWCPGCERELERAQFGRNRANADGLTGYCKPCHRDKSKQTYIRLYGSSREYHLRRRYGITGAEYDAMVEAHGNLCALCRERPPEHVDHDHVTGVVRGVLCSCCNQGLGNFRDNVAALRAAIVYLERTTWQRHRVRPGVFRLTSPRPEAAPSPSSSELQRLISSRRG